MRIEVISKKMSFLLVTCMSTLLVSHVRVYPFSHPRSFHPFTSENSVHCISGCRKCSHISRLVKLGEASGVDLVSIWKIMLQVSQKSASGCYRAWRFFRDFETMITEVISLQFPVVQCSCNASRNNYCKNTYSQADTKQGCHYFWVTCSLVLHNLSKQCSFGDDFYHQQAISTVTFRENKAYSGVIGYGYFWSWLNILCSVS